MDKLKFFNALLNSTLVKFVYQEISQESGRILCQVNPQRIKQIPIIETPFQNLFEKLVDQIIAKKSKGHDTTDLENKIDVMLYKLFELLYEEVKIVDPGFWMSREEYDDLGV